MHDDDRRELEELDLRLRVLLPETYQDTYETLEPKPMGSAGLKYGSSPFAQDDMQINHRNTGRGFYFRDENTHSWEFITHTYIKEEMLGDIGRPAAASARQSG